MGHNITRLAVVAAVGLTGIVVAPATQAAAAGPLTIIVDSPVDGPGTSGACADPIEDGCTLRSAIDLANDHPGSSIYLEPDTYLLDDALTVTGAGTILIGATAGGSFTAGDYVIDAAGGQGIDVNADDVRISGVTVQNAANSNGSGGAIVVRRNKVGFVLADSEIVHNSAREAAGVLVAGSATIRRSTFENNAAERKGGAIRVEGTLELVNSTFTGNTAQSGGAVSVAGTAAISYSTFVDNTSNNEKGAGVDRNGGIVYITGSILTRANQQSADGSDCSGNPDLVGPNYVGNAQGCNPDEAVLIGTDPAVGPLMLPPLADNLGLTRTIRPPSESVTVDAATPGVCSEIGLDGVLDTGDLLVAIDQRGLGRPSGPACDLGAVEATPLTIDLELTADTATPYVGARFLPSAAIAESVIATDSLFDGSLEASPLNAFPLESAPLNAFPLNAFPLNAFPLNAFPLNAFFLAEAPLNAFPLNAFPLNAFPLNAFPLNAFPLSDLVLTEGTWDELLQDSDFEGVPLQSLTLGDVQSVAGVQSLSLGQLNLEGTPLNAFPLNAFLLSSIPLNAFPLNAFEIPEGGTWCDTDAFADFCDAFPVDPATIDEPPVTLATAALAGVPLNAFPLNAFPLNAFPLNAFPLNAFPLNAFPLNAFAWTVSPLNAFPLNAFPLNAFDGGDVVNCGALPGGTCDGATLLDAYLAGAFGDATLGDLGLLFTATDDSGALLYPDAYALLADLTLADLLIGLIPSDSIPWNEVDLTVPGIQNAAPADEWAFHYLANLSLTSIASSLTIDLELPPGFAYVPGGATLDGAPVADPTLSCPAGSCTDTAGNPLPITLTFELTDVAAGAPVLSIATRAGFELGTYTATANAIAVEQPASTPVTAGPSSYPVTVIAPPDSQSSPVIIETVGSNPCLGDANGDVNLGWIASATDGVDFYRFDISPEAAACGVRADIFMSRLPVDLDITLYGPKSTPLRGEPTESIAYLDDVTLDLNPFDDVVQADTVQDIPQVLPDTIADPDAFAVSAISSNRGKNPERIRTGTLRAGAHFLQVTGYNGARANTPYALRLRIDGTVAREACSALPYPGIDGVPDITSSTLPSVDSLPAGLNTLFLVNTQQLEFSYGETARNDVLARFTDGRWATAGVVGAVLPVDADADVLTALQARAADPCDPERSNDVVRAIGAVIDRYTLARPGIENVVIVGDDRQIPMANIVDDANFANERTFSQEFANDANNESIAALAVGRYRSDDPYGAEAGIRIRDHELFVPSRAVGRLVETPTEILAYLDNFLDYGGVLDPDTEQRTALQTGYEFLGDGAEQNATNLVQAGYDVDDSLINETWTDGDLLAALTRSPSDPQLDVIGIHAHFDENNALPAYDNFNPPVAQDELFSSSELPDNVRRAIVYSMGCHSGYSLSDIQIGVGPGTVRPDDTAPDWAQVVTGDRSNTFIGNTGFGYGDTDRVALTEQLTATFADEVGRHDTVGQAWIDAKQRMLSEIFVLDAYQEKSLQQFVFYGLPMFRTEPPVQPAAQESLLTSLAPLASLAAPLAPDTDPNTGQPIVTIDFSRPLPNPLLDPTVPQFRQVDESNGSYFEIDGRTMNVNGHPIQPLYGQDVPSFADVPEFENLEARDALITDLTSFDVDSAFDPLFFWASPNFGGPRPEYFDGSFPAEMAAVRSYRQQGESRQQVLIAAGQYRADDFVSDFGVQRLHTRVEAEVYYSDADDFVPPTIAISAGAFDDDAVRFRVEVDDTAQRVYVLYRAAGESEWDGVDLALLPDGSWTGVGPFTPSDDDNRVEFIVQAVDDHGNVAMSNNKSQYFLESTPGEVSALMLSAAPETGALVNDWFNGDVRVTATGGSDIFYRVDAGAYVPYPTGGILIAADDRGSHVISAYDAQGGFAALIIRIDSVTPAVDIQRFPAEPWSNEPVTVVITANDDGLSGVASIEYSLDDGTTTITHLFPDAPATDPNQTEQITLELADDGITNLTATATDVAGNTSTPASSTVRVDRAAPTVIITRAPDEVWSNEPVTVTITATDSLSDVASIEYSTNGGAFEPYNPPLDISDEGPTTIAARATDVAGNTSTPASSTVRVDRAAPTVIITGAPDEVWSNEPVTVTITATDSLSGVASIEYTTNGVDYLPYSNPVVVSADGITTIAARAFDQAGNEGTAVSPLVIRIDTVLPVVPTLVVTPQVTIGQPANAVYACGDDRSGVQTCVITVTDPSGATQTLATGTTGGTVALPTGVLGTYTVTVTVADRAGNTTQETALYTVVDQTPPVATISVLKSIVNFGAANEATFGCTDADSGIATCTVVVTQPDGTTVDLNTANAPAGSEVDLPVSQSGTYTVTVTATDLAGNIATSTATYRVDLCVVELYDYTQAKNVGSNYTIKISLCGPDGNNISSKQTVLTAISITDAAGNTYDPGPNDSGSANGGAGVYEFRYSNRKSYIYNLNTTGFSGQVPGQFTLDFEAAEDGVVIGVGHARFTLSG